MTKKFLSIVATAALVVSGLASSPAQAVTPFATGDSLGYASVYASVEMAQKNKVVVPAGQNWVNATASFTMDNTWLAAHAGQKLTFTGTAKDINGNDITYVDTASMNSAMPDGMAFEMSPSGSIYATGMGGCSSVYSDYMTKSLTIPANTTGCGGSFGVNLSLVGNYATGDTELPAGTYTFEYVAYANGVAIDRTEAGLTEVATSASYNFRTSPTTLPAGTTSANAQGTICVDSSKIAVGDEVTAEIWIDGANVGNTPSWSTRSALASKTDANYRTGWGTYALSTIVTQFDIDHGLAANISSMIANPTGGTSYTWGFKVYNKTTSADVSGSCKPAKPATPTLTYANSMLTATSAFSAGSENYASICYLYDAAAPATVVTKSFPSPPMGPTVSANYTCDFKQGLIVGHTYFVKVQNAYQMVKSDISDASSNFLIPAPGYTVTSTHDYTVAAGKVVKTTATSPLDTDASSQIAVADGRNGAYLVAQVRNSSNAGLTGVHITRTTQSGADATFGGSGSVKVDGMTVAPGNFLGLGFYGTSQEKFSFTVGGYSGPTPKLYVYYGTNTSSSTTSVEVTKAQFDTACGAASTGYALPNSYQPSMSPISTSGATPLYTITCYKSYTLADTNTAQLTLPVLVTVAANGDLTVVKTLGTPSASANSFRAVYSTNPSATGSGVMVTALVTSQLITAQTTIGCCSLSQTGTVAEHTVVRIGADLSVVSSTDAGWGATGGAISESTTTATLNDGTVFALCSTTSAGVTTFKLEKFTATGVATEVTVDLTAVGMTNPRLLFPQGQIAPGNETLLYVIGQVATTPVAPTTVAPVYINTSTGVATAGEKVTYTTTTGNGVVSMYMRGTDKNVYWLFSSTTNGASALLYKWIDSRYVVPSGPVPTVTSKDAKYSKNTPASGTKITLTGTNLSGVTSAKIGGVNAALGTKSATSLQLTVPTATAAGTVDIVLTTADGEFTVDTFTYVGAGVAQTVTVTAPGANATVGDADATPTATVTASPSDAGSVGAITWSSTTTSVCSIVSGKVRYLTSGTCTVKAVAAASGLLLAGEATKSITVAKGSQSVTLTAPTSAEIDPDGFSVSAVSSKGLAVTYSTTTPSVCTAQADGTVIGIALGDCVVVATAATNISYNEASAQKTVTIKAAATTPIVDNGNPSAPTTISKTGAYIKNGDVSLAWNRTKGALTFRIGSVYLGSIKGTAVFKVGTKSYTCNVSFGILKKQSSVKRNILTSPSFCSAKTEATALAALKKIATNGAVKITIVRDLREPLTYGKVRLKTRIIYIKLG